ncbi:hypothetical protein, partial [Staphylococcus capitis]|uniref:hypothetical protein n=1 Tax=Staphylococcus capitis TaxID=29388 RepID=UPI0021B34C44
DVFLEEGELAESEMNGKDCEEMFEVVWGKIEKGYEGEKEKLGDEMSEFEGMILLGCMDSDWRDDMDTMDELGEGIELG